MCALDDDPRDVPLSTPSSLFAHGSWSGNQIYCAITDRFPELKDQLPRSLRALVAWHRREVTDSAPPHPPMTCPAMAGWAWINGPVLQVFALCLLTCFDCMLRPSELFLLSRSDLQFDEARSQSGLGISLSFDTKTATRTHGHVWVRDALLAVLLRDFFYHLPGTTLLWPYTQAEFRSHFRQAACAVGVEAVGFRPYSLRRGGATSDFRSHGSWDITCDRGRWASAKTARLYLKDALAHTIEAGYSAEQRKKLQHFYDIMVRAGLLANAKRS